jgi:hypothetical protein
MTDTLESRSPRPLMALQLPPDYRKGGAWSEPEGVEGDSIPEGKGIRWMAPTRPGAQRLLDHLLASGPALQSLAPAERARCLGRAGARFLDPEAPLRREALRHLPGDAGLSPPAARELLDRMAGLWTPETLQRLLDAEFPAPFALDRFQPGPEGQRVRAEGDALAFHIGAGNVAGVGATSIVRSLLVGTPLLMKPGLGDLVLPVLLGRALAESCPVLAQAVAVVYWPGGEPSVLEELALTQARRVVVYGGLDTVASLRRRLPPTTPLLAYRHRVSAGAVARERLDALEPARALAEGAARSVVAYDQMGCVSPHLIWVEEGGAVGPEEWARLLARELERVGRDFPPGPVPPERAARIQQLRGEAELTQAMGAGSRVWASPDSEWTVILESEFGFAFGPGGRLVRVQPVPSLEELPELLRPHGPVLQSLALEAAAGRREALAGELGRIGVGRVTTFARQAWPDAWWIHDGQGPLRALVRWTALETDTGR